MTTTLATPPATTDPVFAERYRATAEGIRRYTQQA